MAKYLYPLPQAPYFTEYIHHPQLFTPQEVSHLRQIFDENEARVAPLDRAASPGESELRRSTIVTLLPEPQLVWAFERIAQWAYQVNQERYAFDLQGLNEGLQLARYTTGDFFDWHLDFGPGGISNRKLSITVQLAEENAYEGGDLQIMINEKFHNMPRAAGSATLFPSFMQHRVTPITKGDRYSLVGWVNGPPFR